MAAKKLEYKVWSEKVDSNHPDAKERGVRTDGHYDWRDEDTYLELDGGGVRSKVYSRDEQYNQHRGSVEPDWDKGWFLMKQDGSGKVLMEFKGPCPEPFRSSLLEGRELVGCIISRDFQVHN